MFNLQNISTVNAGSFQPARSVAQKAIPSKITLFAIMVLLAAPFVAATKQDNSLAMELFKPASQAKVPPQILQRLLSEAPVTGKPSPVALHRNENDPS